MLQKACFHLPYHIATLSKTWTASQKIGARGLTQTQGSFVATKTRMFAVVIEMSRQRKHNSKEDIKAERRPQKTNRVLWFKNCQDWEPNDCNCHLDNNWWPDHDPTCHEWRDTKCHNDKNECNYCNQTASKDHFWNIRQSLVTMLITLLMLMTRNHGLHTSKVLTSSMRSRGSMWNQPLFAQSLFQWFRASLSCWSKGVDEWSSKNMI